MTINFGSQDSSESTVGYNFIPSVSNSVDNKQKTLIRSPAYLTEPIEKVTLLLATTLWMGIFVISASLLVLVFILPRPYSAALFTFMAAAALVPVNENSKWGKSLAKWIAVTVPQYFPLKVVVEDPSSIDPECAYVIAYEPHSVWPLGVIAFAYGSTIVPLKKVRTLGSSALDHIPLCRHLWKWMGMAAVSRESFSNLLASGTSCVIIPGGVQECLHLSPTQEVLYLKKRLGFIRMAMSSGAPIIPTFCFGQRDTYRYWFPKQRWFQKMSRQLKFAPLFYWGLCGGPLPLAVPMTVVIGKPIAVSQNSNPTQEELVVVQEQFIHALSLLYEKYKTQFNSEKVDLVIL